MGFIDYWITLFNFGPIFIYVIVIVTFIPQSWKRIKNRAIEERLKYVRFHRCYGIIGECCHLRNKVHLNQIESDFIPESEKQVHIGMVNNKNQEYINYHKETNENVNRIAKMFENNCSKLNQITPALADHKQKKSSEKFEKVFQLKMSEKISLTNNLEKECQKVFNQTELKAILTNSENVISEQTRLELQTTLPPSEETSAKHSNYSGPVTSIEEILAQRRLSRPLSAYSISDLLGDNLPDEMYIDNFLKNLNS